MLRTLRPAVLLLPLWIAPAWAATWEYTVAVPDGREATFELPFPVAYDGPVTIEASWTGPRLLFFAVEGPGRAPLASRSGPSPQRLDLTAANVGAGSGWTLTIKALPARGEASGRLKVTVPDAPEVAAKREEELHPPPPPPPPPPSWMRAQAAPAGSPPEIARVYDAVDAVRASVVSTTDGPGDACSWQLGFLAYAAAARDRLPGAPPDEATLRYFVRLSQAIRSVDLLRVSTDPVIAGPVPEDRNARRDWLMARNEVVRPVERSLDQLNELLRRGFAPALQNERWLPRLNACLTACERFYDERVRSGDDEIVSNPELARAQWDGILRAERAVAAFAALLKDPSSP